MKKGMPCIPGHVERPSDPRVKERTRPAMAEVVRENLQLKLRPERLVRCHSWARQVTLATDKELACRETLVNLLKELRRVPVPEGERRLFLECDKALETCAIHSRDTAKKLRSAQKEMERLPLHSERVGAMMAECERKLAEPPSAEQQGDAKRLKTEA